MDPADPDPQHHQKTRGIFFLKVLLAVFRNRLDLMGQWIRVQESRNNPQKGKNFER
jgi:hypothetical protein